MEEIAGVPSEKSIPANIDAPISNLISETDVKQMEFRELDDSWEWQKGRKRECGQSNPTKKIQFGCEIQIRQLADNTGDVIRLPLVRNGRVPNQSIRLAEASGNLSPILNEYAIRGNIGNTLRELVASAFR
jgi:hypothetical protein